jgi:hypothetical protein
MKKTVGQTLQAIRAHPDGIADFLDDVPDAIPYAKGMMRAITEKRIPLHGTPYQVAQRADSQAHCGVRGCRGSNGLAVLLASRRRPPRAVGKKKGRRV